MPALEAFWQALRANPRLRWGMWLVGFILWTYGLLLLDEHVDAARTEYSAAAARHARADAAASETDWPDRLRAVRAAEARIDSRLWRESSPGLAQAAFQDWLGLAARGANLANTTLAVSVHEESFDPAAAGTAVMWRARARLGANFTPAALAVFLKAVAENERAIIVEGLVVRGGAMPPRVEFTLASLFQPPAGDAPAADRTSETPGSP